MRLLYPLLVALAYLFFVAALAVGFAAVALVPVLAVAAGVALAATGQFALLIRLAGSLVRITLGALGRALGMLRDLWLAIFGGTPEPRRLIGSYGREALPAVFRLVDEVAAEVGTRPVDRVLVTHGDNAGVLDLPSDGTLPWPRRRTLILGIPIAYLLTLDQLRGVLAHELAHFRRGHVLQGRITGRFLQLTASQLDRMEEGDLCFLSPVYWSVRASHGVLHAAFHPWSRLRELEADRLAARAAGANHFVSALRRLRDNLPSLMAAQEAVVDWSRRNGAAPRHLGEAAERVSRAMPPMVRKRLALAQQGDLHDLEGQTHPPIPVRIAALHGVKELPARWPEIAARYLPDLRNLEEHLTRGTLREEVLPSAELAGHVLAELAAGSAESA